MQLDFKVNEQIITHENPEKKVVADSIKYLTCKFTFSEDWNGITKTAIFISASGDAYNVILDKNETCNVPYEVIKYPHFIISIFGGDRITANKFVIDVAKSGYCKGETPKEPTPDVYAQILSKLDGIEVGEVDEEQIKEIVNEVLKSIQKTPTRAFVNILGGIDNWIAEDVLDSNKNVIGTRYGQVVNVNNAVVTPYSKVDLQITSEQVVVFHEKDLAFVAENDNGVVTIYCIGSIPQNNYTIQAVITEVIVNG